MKSKIEKFLNKYNLAAKDKIIVVGFSGGYDSMSLLHVVKCLSLKYNFKIVAAHLNHNWRGEESLKEQKNCQNFCIENNIEFYFETLSDKEKHTETRARELRYDFFERVIKQYNADALLTAHTKSDTAETILYRIIKGTGIKGLQGISPTLGKIFRPMLDISRFEVENYCRLMDLKPNNDSSNTDNKYSRNFIRNEILPLLNKINPQVEKSINSMSVLAYENEQIIKEYISNLNLYDGDKIITKKFEKLTKFVQKRVIYELYVKYNFEYTQEKIENTLNFVLENLKSKSGKKCSINSDYFLFVSYKNIQVINKGVKSAHEVKINSEGTYIFDKYIFSIKKCCQTPEVYPKDSKFEAYVELDEINFTLRTRKHGDTIQPLGTNKITKLKKYLINKNIPQHEKDAIILLCKDAEVLWVSGYGINDKIKVVNNCTHVLTLKKIGGTVC